MMGWPGEPDDYRLMPASICVGSGEDGTNIGALGVGCDVVPVQPTGPEPAPPEIRPSFVLWPNPATRRARAVFELDGAGRVEVRLVDVAGRVRARWMRSLLSGGRHHIEVPGSGSPDLAPGVYVVQLDVDGVEKASRRLVILR